MNLAGRYIHIVLVLMWVFAGTGWAGVRVSAEVDTSSDIYVGEPFTYYIVIDGENKPGDVDLTKLQEYNPQNVGNKDVSQTSMTIINGRTTKNVSKRYIMSYSLTANRPGQMVIPSVTVTIDGQSYSTNAVTVNILQPATTSDLELEVVLSEKQCYVGQPILVTVKFYVSAEIGQFSFNIPVFNSADFYVEDPDVVGRNAQLYRLNGGITVYVSKYQVVHNGKNSILLSFSKVLIPKRTGRIETSAATVSADVVVGRVRSRDPFFDDFFGAKKKYKRFMAYSEPVRLDVQPLPEEGKPAGFYGLVGRYTISASAEPTKVNVGDPITLTIKIGGSRYLKAVQWPALEDVRELAANFKIPSQKGSPTIEDGFKVFTQTIRANNDKVKAIPSIPLAFFDPEKGRYVVTKTEPIKLDVAPTKILTSADLVGTGPTMVNKEVEAIKKGLSANYESLDALENQSFSPLAAAFNPGYLVLWAGPFAALVFSFLIRLLTHTTPEKTALKRRRQACRRSVQQLRKIVSAPVEQRYELLSAAMKRYVGERFDKTTGSLTADDCFEVIVSAGADTRTAERYRAIVGDCEAARYASVETNVDAAQVKEVIKLIREIEKKAGK